MTTLFILIPERCRGTAAVAPPLSVSASSQAYWPFGDRPGGRRAVGPPPKSSVSERLRPMPRQHSVGERGKSGGGGGASSNLSGRQRFSSGTDDAHLRVSHQLLIWKHMAASARLDRTPPALRPSVRPLPDSHPSFGGCVCNLTLRTDGFMVPLDIFYLCVRESCEEGRSQEQSVSFILKVNAVFPVWFQCYTRYQTSTW